jgi:hypothetical protein
MVPDPPQPVRINAVVIAVATSPAFNLILFMNYLLKQMSVYSLRSCPDNSRIHFLIYKRIFTADQIRSVADPVIETASSCGLALSNGIWLTHI